MLKRRLLFWFVLVLVLMLAGCGGGGGFFSTGGFEGKAIVPYGVRGVEVTDESKQKIAVTSVDTIPSDYQPLVDAVVSSAGKTTRTDINGNFTLTGLPIGTQAFTISDPDYATYRGYVDIEANRVKQVGLVDTVHDEKEWLVMVYMGADNNLEYEAVADINEMEQLGSNSNVDIVVQADYKSVDGGYRYYIEKDPANSSEIFSMVVDELEEIDSGDPDELRSFVSWAVNNYPARNKLLVVWDHGDGWRIWNDERFYKNKAISKDETNGTIMDIDQLANAIYPFDVDMLVFDACLMNSIEVAWEMATRTGISYMVGSQENVIATGLDYTLWLSELIQQPAISQSNLATEIALSYGQSEPGWAMSVVDLTTLSSVVTEIAGLTNMISSDASLLSQVKNNVWPNLTRYPTDSELGSIMYEGYIDLHEFATALEAELSLDTSDLITALNNSVIYATNTPYSYNGISIASNVDSTYQFLTFADTGWGSLVKSLNQ